MATGLVLGTVAFFAAPAYAGDSPSGFVYGTDSYQPTVTLNYPATEPVIDSGLYGAYGAEISTWGNYLGCTSGRAVNSTDVIAANQDVTYAVNHNFVGVPLGTYLYFYAGGPGVDPNYNGTTTEAYNWGYNQAEYAISQWAAIGPEISSPLIFMDVEQGNRNAGQPEYYNGWNSRASNCGETVLSSYMAPNLDQATVDGYLYALDSSPDGFYQSVYSSPGFWSYTFGSSYGSIPNAYEWTSENESASITPGASGWCMGSTCAAWFGGTDHPLIWQWTTNAPDLNSVGDFDQVDDLNF